MQNTSLKTWFTAFRLRTLPLTLACIGMGTFLAVYYQIFNWPVFILAVTTTLCLQILSNLANDYGDSVHGADSAERLGPARMVQSGEITKEQMKKAMIVFVLLSLVNGLALLWVAFAENLEFFFKFLGLGVSAILAAIAYTNGKKPYGYAGLGDLFVFIFFGPVAVAGVYFLFDASMNWAVLLPAVSCGAFSVGVLNLNNIRDIESDEKAGKKSIPVRLGRKKAVLYHQLLIALGWASATIYVLEQEGSWLKFLFLLSLPMFMVNIKAVQTKLEASALDPYLKQLAISTLVFVLLFGLGLLLS